jgi:DNA-binding transcriptional ArsR family regulator
LSGANVEVQEAGANGRPQRGRTPPPFQADAAAIAEMARLARAVAHPVRVRILAFLAGQPTCFHGELADHLPLAKSTISQHLKVLREAGLVKVRTHGSRSNYCLRAEGVERLAVLAAGLRDLGGTPLPGGQP